MICQAMQSVRRATFILLTASFWLVASPDTQMRMDARGAVTGYLNPPDSSMRIHVKHAE